MVAYIFPDGHNSSSVPYARLRRRSQHVLEGDLNTTLIKVGRGGGGARQRARGEISPLESGQDCNYYRSEIV